MNPNRHHEYMGSKEDQLPATYFNRMEERFSHSSYFPQDDKRQDTITNNKVACRCNVTSSNITCKLCRTGVSTERGWNIVVPVQCENIQYSDPQSSHRQSPIYMHTNIPTRLPYLSKSESNENIISTDKKRIIINMPSNGNCAIETSYNNYNGNQIRHQSQTQHHSMTPQNSSSMTSYYKDRSYNDGCSSNQDLNVGPRIGYSSVATIPNPSAICNTDEQRSNSTDVHCPIAQKNKHIVNYNNIRNSNEKNPSSNYSRQCSQVFSTGESNSAHVSLYVSTPQFSSEKFTMVPTQSPISMSNPQLQRKPHIEQCRGNHNSNIVTSHLENKNHNINDIMQPQNITQQSMCSDYFESSLEDKLSVGNPVMNQSKHHPHFQYSKSTSIPTNAPCMVTPKISSDNIGDYVRKENTDYYNSSGTSFERDYYINLYNTPASSDNCYKAPLTNYTSTGYRNEYFKGYHRFIKSTQEKPLLINEYNNQRALSTSRDSNHKIQSNCCKTQQNNLDGIINTGTPLSTESSPSMKPLQSKMHHIEYSSSIQHAQSCNNEDQSYKTLPTKISSKVSCINMTGNIQSLTVQLAPPNKQPTYSTKRSQVVKPNYKELINQVYAMRNSTSEEELNLKIIRKTLNVDTQSNRSVISSANEMESMPQLVDLASQKHNLNVVCKRSSDINTPEAPQSLLKVPFAVDNTRRSNKLIEKSNPVPLDLSMRTVKTKADSTEYKYSQQSTNSKVILPNIATPALPRVDFTPNFSLHTSDELHSKSLNDSRQKPIDRSPQTKCLTLHQSPNIKNVPDISKPPISTSTSVAISVQNFSTIQQPPQQHSLITDISIKTTNSSIVKNVPQSQIHSGNNIDSLDKPSRPTVLETNSYAVAKTHFKHKLTNRNVPTIDNDQYDSNSNTAIAVSQQIHDSEMQLNPQSSITQVVSPLNEDQSHSLIKENLNNEVCQRYLGKKRHIKEYQFDNAPIIKKPCYEELSTDIPSIRLTDPNLVSFNEKLPSEFKNTKENQNGSNNHIDDYKNDLVTHVIQPTVSVSVLKTSTKDAIVPFANIKAEPNNSNATVARIRTKAELKGFTFPINFDSPIINNNLLNSDSNPSINGNTSIKENIKIKEEYPDAFNSNIESIPDLKDDCYQIGVLDFNWSTTCNNFMEQLILSSKKSKTPPPPTLPSVLCNTMTTAVKFEPSEDDSAITMRSFSMSQDTVSTSKLTAQKKTNKLDREKMRLQQEARIAARLQEDTSSESDNEIEKRKTERLKKPMKRNKPRFAAFAFANGNRFSDCGSDSTAESVLLNNKIIKNVQNYKELITIDTKSENNVLESVRKQLSPNFDNDADKSYNINDSKSKKNFVTHKIDDCSMDDDNVSQKTLNETQNNIDSYKKDTSPISKNIKNEHIDSKMEGEESNIKDSNDDHLQRYKNDTKNLRAEKPMKREKLIKKIELNTMTRSKRKQALELQLANSKVLRNDKIIGNSTAKNKRKYIRKYTNSQNVDTKDATLLSSKNDNIQNSFASKRLRSKDDNSTKQILCNTQKSVGPNRKRTRCNSKASDSSIEITKDHQTIDLLMEMYRYKRSLKIPPSLISIKHPNNDKITASLPDLECDNHRITSSYMRHRSKSRFILKSQSKSELSETEGPISIIDYLHSRLKTTTKTMKNKPTISHNTVSCSMSICSESGQNDETDLSSTSLPTPKQTAEDSSSGKKRHFSIFETKVLKTKTRTESKLQQKREIIREIFVGDDRAASAPPDMIMAIDNSSNMTYEQKYEQFLHQMNIEFDEDKLSKFGRTKTSIIPFQTSNFNNKDDIIKNVKTIGMNEKDNGNNQRDNISVMLRMAPTKFRRRRPGKYLRRKGSSGFDYIRKKKKTVSSTISNHQSMQMQNKMEQLEEEDNIKVKTEIDVCREIQKWVLNKGVGQSAMHKAARLGYIDVIVYCLDRMDLNPNQKDNAGYTPLHEACTNGRLEIARLLLQYGANHSEAAHSGIRPLHEACENDHEEIVRLLLSYGADPLLATYSGQTPIMLASSSVMKQFLMNHLSDVQNMGNEKKPWSVPGLWEIYDSNECGYDIFAGAPNMSCDMSKALRKSLVSNIFKNRKNLEQYGETSCKTIMSKCAVVLDNIHGFNSIRLYNNAESEYLVDNSDSDGDIFEFEEADVLLPPLYLLKDEGTAEKWVLLNDLCNLLKVKSKDTLLNKIQPSSSMPSPHKSLMRELKMSDFLEKATCLQLLCAGEKINICASKVVLIKYNESVKNLLGVKTILMKF